MKWKALIYLKGEIVEKIADSENDLIKLVNNFMDFRNKKGLVEIYFFKGDRWLIKSSTEYGSQTRA